MDCKGKRVTEAPSTKLESSVQAVYISCNVYIYIYISCVFVCVYIYICSSSQMWSSTVCCQLRSFVSKAEGCVHNKSENSD